jgi:uncharacterized delta-60 repeat protein
MKIASLVAAASIALVAAPALAQPGHLDPTFGNGGINTVQLPHDHWPYVVAAAPAGGGFAVAGVSWVPQGRNLISHLGVVRFNANGSLDTTFGNGGYAHHNLNGAISSSNKLAVQNDGKIVFSRSPWFPIVRLNTNGSLDASFGSSGIVNEPTTGDNWTVRDFTFTPDGKILAVGSRRQKVGKSFGPDNTALMRYNINGTLDTTFGSGGIIVYQYSSGTDIAGRVAGLPDGRFVTLSGEDDAGGVRRSWFTRYHANGTRDASFGSGGRVLYQAQIYDNEDPDSLDVAQDGSILTMVSLRHGGQGVPRPGYIRLHTDGSIDTAFGDGGLAHPEVQWATGGRGAERQQDGAFVTICSGDPGTGTNHLMMLRMTPDGQIDTAYGPHGNGMSVLVPWTSGIGLQYNLDGMDRSIATGRVAGAANNQLSVARFLSE